LLNSQRVELIPGGLVPEVLIEMQRMKTAMIALLALACGATVWAGTPPVSQLPDGGSSALLLGMGVIAVVRSLRR